MNFFTKFLKKKITSLDELHTKYSHIKINYIINDLIDKMVPRIVNVFKDSRISRDKLASLSWKDFKLFYPIDEFNKDLQSALNIDEVIKLSEDEIIAIFKENRERINILINDIYFKLIKHNSVFSTIDELVNLQDKPGDVARAQNFKVNSVTRNYAIAYIDNKLYIGASGEHHADLVNKYLDEKNILLTKKNGSIIHDPDQFDFRDAVQNDCAIDATTETDINFNVPYMFGHVWNLIGFIDDISPDTSFDEMAKLIKSQLNLDKVYRHNYNSPSYPRLAKLNR